jgi:hypothetical protein
MLVDGGERRQPKPASNLFEAGGVPVLLDEIVEVVEDLPLALGQWQHDARTIRKGKAKVNWAVTSFTSLVPVRSKPMRWESLACMGETARPRLAITDGESAQLGPSLDRTRGA